MIVKADPNVCHVRRGWFKDVSWSIIDRNCDVLKLCLGDLLNHTTYMLKFCKSSR
jgi:hypothetical protein